MIRVEADGRWIEYEETGSGDPVLLIHGTLLGDSLEPLMTQQALSGYRLIRYHRRGYCGNPVPRGAGWLGIADHAADAAMLLDYLSVDSVHVVGHDVGGLVALQLALLMPDIVHSLALLEPVLLEVPSWGSTLGEVSPAMDAFMAGDRRGAVENFLAIGSGPDCLETVEDALPGGVEQAIEDCPSFFEGEMFAVGEWLLAGDIGLEITQPVLSVLSEHPIGFFSEGRKLLQERLPQTETLDIFSSTHLLPLENPEMLATGLDWFMGRHSIRR